MSAQLKDILAQAIETYAAARPTGNTQLMEFAASRLNQILGAVDVVELPQPDPDTLGSTPPEDDGFIQAESLPDSTPPGEGFAAPEAPTRSAKSTRAAT